MGARKYTKRYNKNKRSTGGDPTGGDPAGGDPAQGREQEEGWARQGFSERSEDIENIKSDRRYIKAQNLLYRGQRDTKMAPPPERGDGISAQFLLSAEKKFDKALKEIANLRGERLGEYSHGKLDKLKNEIESAKLQATSAASALRPSGAPADQWLTTHLSQPRAAEELPEKL